MANKYIRWFLYTLGVLMFIVMLGVVGRADLEVQKMLDEDTAQRYQDYQQMLIQQQAAEEQKYE